MLSVLICIRPTSGANSTYLQDYNDTILSPICSYSYAGFTVAGECDDAMGSSGITTLLSRKSKSYLDVCHGVFFRKQLRPITPQRLGELAQDEKLMQQAWE